MIPPLQPTRILLDLSHTYFENYRTGIQRVVRSLQLEFPKIAAELGFDFAVIVLVENEFVFVDGLETNNVGLVPKVEDVLKKLPRWYIVLASCFCSVVRLKIVEKWLLPAPGHLGIFKHIKRFRKVSTNKPKPTEDSKSNRVQFSPSDILLMPDGYWVLMHIWDAVARAKMQGAKVSVVVYDLICITHPHFFGAGAKECFTKYLQALNQHVDMAVAISKTVERELCTKLSQLATDDQKPPQCKSFRLGVTIENPEGEIRASVQALFDHKEKPYLMVSTFEPRKNHTFVLDSFDIRWKESPSQKLLFVGALGWMSEETIERIQTHKLYGSQLLMINDASDAEVQFCYENCVAAIYPSIVEGFGLPIIEALRNGKTIFASDTPIHREVGKQHCQYFDLSEPSSLVVAMESWERGGYASPSPALNQLVVSWNDSSRQLAKTILELQEHLNSGNIFNRVA